MGLFDAMGRGGGVPVDENGNPIVQPPPPAGAPPLSGAPYSEIADNWWQNPGEQQGPFYDNPDAFKDPASTDRIFPAIFSSGNPPTGWFTMEDYYMAQNPRPDPPPGWDAAAELRGSYSDDPAVQAFMNWRPNAEPMGFSMGANLPSTNDYRLLPPPYNHPNFFMVNGTIIDRTRINPSIAEARELSRTGPQSGSAAGYPIAFTVPGWSGGTPFGGWPGDINGWRNLS